MAIFLTPNELRLSGRASQRFLVSNKRERAPALT